MENTEGSCVLYEVTGAVATLALNTPENFNAMSVALLDGLGAALERAAEDDGVRAVVIRAEGRAFCAGGDIREMKRGIDGGDGYALTRIVRKAGDVARRIRSLPKPVIAALHGAVAGAGCSLALMCDFRVASDDVKFIEAFVNIGLVPDMGGTYVLSRYVGLGRLTEYLMTGRPITAREAYDMGMLHVVTEREALTAEAMAMAARLSALPAESLAGIKSLINQALFSDLTLSLEREEEYQTRLSCSDDYREGVMAFLEKRKPAFGPGKA